MRRLHELYSGPLIGCPAPCPQEHEGETENGFVIPGYRDHRGKKLRIHILAMGDVGGTLALAMKLTGADLVSEIGICDISETVLKRWEQELNQIALPRDLAVLPQVVPVTLEHLFDCDVFVFCASRGVPDVTQTDVDVRMVQLEKNLELVKSYASQAVKEHYDGEFFVVSDPVDPLCQGAVLAGLAPTQVQGFGLGVMNGRAAYFARQTGQPETIALFTKEGRVFGPHGEDLVVANSIAHYDDAASLELTQLTVEANLQIRKLGYKPYIAPAVTSGALSILENLRGNWQYSSAWFGPVPAAGAAGAFLGMRNRRCQDGLWVEDLPLDDQLFARIERAYDHLKQIWETRNT